MILIKLVIPLIIFAVILFALLLGLQANDTAISINLILFEVKNINPISLTIWAFASGGLLGLLISYLPILKQSLKIKQLSKKLAEKEQQLLAMESAPTEVKG